MAKRSRTDEALHKYEIQLPESMIQHIQSYLNGKQAAQTTILSKSWYNAWLTRPTLEFDQWSFEKRPLCVSPLPVSDEFSNYVEKIMKRYEDSNLKIVTFRLFMSNTGRESVALANELISKAVKMGVSDLNLRMDSKDNNYVLPKEVFQAESLFRLSLSGCEIAPPLGRKVLCSRLGYLNLRNDRIGEDTLGDIILSCPLLEDLLLDNCKGPRGHTYLRFKTSLTELGKREVRPVVDFPIEASDFCKLKYLTLERVYLESSFFHEFSIKFSILKGLTLRHCYCDDGIQISSHSLECISLVGGRISRAKFSVPNIRYFEMNCQQPKIPSVCFISAPKEWESEISISSAGYFLRASWLLELKRLLKKLSRSKISLNLPDFMAKHMRRYIDYVRRVERLPRPVVENLMLSLYVSFSSVEGPILDGLFLCCQPKLITVAWSTSSNMLEEANNHLPEDFTKLIQLVGTSFCIPEQNMLRLSDLEEVVEVENAEKQNNEWSCMPWKTWLDTRPSLVLRHKIHLKMTLRAT